MSQSMKRIANGRSMILLVMSMFFMLSFAGLCYGSEAEVPPGHIGMLQGPDGLSDDVLQPGKFRLDARCSSFGSQCDRLILAEVSDFRESETLAIFMPKDQLTVTVEVSGQYQVDPAKADLLFDRMQPQPWQTGTKDGQAKFHGTTQMIYRSRVFDTYAEQAVVEEVRSFLRGQTIDDVLRNSGPIGDEITNILRDKLKDTPIKVVQFGFANVTPPQIILTANERAKEREVAIEEAKANKLVALEEAEAAKAVALLTQEVDLIEAETQKLVNEKLAESTSPAFVVQRSLKILEKMAESGSTVFVIPADMAEGGATGFEFSMFQEGLK